MVAERRHQTDIRLQDNTEESMCSSKEEENFERKPPEGFGTRHTLAILGFLCTASNYTLRFNLSIAIIAMVNQTSSETSEQSEACPLPEKNNETDTSYSDGSLDWDEQTQGLILGAFFYGYAATNIISGVAAEYWGGKIIVGTGMIITAILTLLSPLFANTSTWLLILARILEGAASGCLFPGLVSMISNWYPTSERSKFTSIIFADIICFGLWFGIYPELVSCIITKSILEQIAGCQFGTVIALPISGVLCDSEFLDGWPSAFYVFGIITLVWASFWFLLVSDDPMDHPRISKDELNFIIQGCPAATKNLKKAPTPWKKVLASKEVWAIAMANFCNNWIFYTMLTELPTYLDQIQHYNIKSNGFLSALPYLGTWLFSLLYSTLINKLYKNGTIALLSVRRISMVIGEFGPSIGFVIMCFVNCNSTIAVIVLILGQSLNGAMYCGYMCSHVDISPRFSGTLMGITNTLGTVPGFVSPLVAGAITQNNQTLWAWRTIFMIAIAVALVSNTFYLIFVSTDIQPWNEPEVSKDKEKDNQQPVDSFTDGPKI